MQHPKAHPPRQARRVGGWRLPSARGRRAIGPPLPPPAPPARRGGRPPPPHGASAPAAAAPAAAAPAADRAAPTTQLTTHLERLSVRDFALVERQSLELGPGLTVVTGESGAGKSVLLSALALLQGAPAPEGAVRPPAAAAVVEGVWALAPADAAALRPLLPPPPPARKQAPPPPHANGAAAGDGYIRVAVRREIRAAAGGRLTSRCAVGGAAVPLRTLRALGAALVDVNGQHASAALRNGAAQLALLDRAAGAGAAAARAAAAWARARRAEGALRALRELDSEGARAALQELADDVAAARVAPGEDRRLRRRLRQLDARRAAAERCALAAAALGGGGGGVPDALAEVERQLRGVLADEERLALASGVGEADGDDDAEPEADDEEDEAGPDDDGDGGESPAALLQGAMAALAAAREAVADAEAGIGRYARRYRFSQAEHDEVSERLQALARLARRHGAADADALLAAAAAADADLDAYFTAAGRRDELAAEAAAARAAAGAAAAALTARRAAAAAALGAAVGATLADLAMPGARFEVRLEWEPLAAADPDGADGADGADAGGGGPAGGLLVAAEQLPAAGVAVAGGDAPPAAGAYRMRPAGLEAARFLFAAGPGEPLRPLGGVASGGEAARVMLALKAAPALMPADWAAGLEPEGAVAGADGDGGAAAAPERAPPVLLLDEIDSGVGGRLGGPVARVLRRLAGAAAGGGPRAQVLCVSHLPQVAAAAEAHVAVRKAAGADGRVTTEFVALAGEGARLEEVAAMLGDGAAGAARALLDEAAAEFGAAAH